VVIRVYIDVPIEINEITMIKAYDALSMLLQNPDDSDAWQLNFNKVAKMIERRDAENSGDLPFGTSLPAWYCEKNDENNILFSPPIVHGKKAVRLSVPVACVGNGTHINARVHVLGKNLKPIRSQFACLTTTQLSLLSIFAVWDTVARIGTKEAVNAGIVTRGWVGNVFSDIRCSAYDPYSQLGRYTRGSKLSPRNLELLHLERQLFIHDIPLSAVHGEGRRDNAGRYYNSWFKDNYCTACGRRYSYPSRRYPNAFLSHVKTIKHRKNAAIFLLREVARQGSDEKE